MKTSELVAQRHEIHRKVGVHVPIERSAVGLAVGMYRELGIDVEIAGRTLYLEVGSLFALEVQHVLERFTGIRAFNEWE